MKTTIRTTYVIFVLGLILATQAFAADVSGTVSLGNYQLISKTRVDRINYDYVFKASATNKGAALKNVSATLVNPPSGTSVLDSALSFGDLAAGATAASSDTFSFRQNRLNELKPENLTWQISGEHAVANSGTISGIVVDTSGRRVASAQVQLGVQTVVTHTNGDGEFTANFGPGEISAGNLVLVSASAAGYVETQAKVALGSGTSYSVTLTVKPVAAEQTVAQPLQTQVNLAVSGKAELQMPAGSILDNNDQPVSEQVKVQLTPLDPTNPQERAVFPGGDFLAIDPGNPPASSEFISLESIALAEVKLLGASGATYSRLGSPATLEMIIPESLQARYNAGDTIPLWFYDAVAGLWQREGDSTVFLNGTDGKKWTRASVSHFSWWNVDEPIGNHACLKFKPVDAGSGAPLAGKTYYLDGVSYTGRSQGTANLDEIGVNGKLDVTTPQQGLLLVGTGTSNYYLEQTGHDLYKLSGNTAAAKIFTLPNVQGNYGANPANCSDLGTIRIDLTPPANSPPLVTVNHPGAVTCGQTVTLTADVTDPDGNLPANPNPVWETACGNFTSTSLTGATIQWKPYGGDCEVRLSVTDEAGATGTGSTVVDCTTSGGACPDPGWCGIEQHWNFDICKCEDNCPGLSCGDYQHLNFVSCQCEYNCEGHSCGDYQHWNFVNCQCEYNCEEQTCGTEDQHWNYDLCQCECPDGQYLINGGCYCRTAEGNFGPCPRR